MKEVKKIAEGKNFSAVDFGKLNELGDYVLSLGDIKIPGKVFGGQALGTKGSVVRVSPEGKRTIHNNGTEPMVVLCVQYRETPFTQEDATDGVILNDQVKW